MRNDDGETDSDQRDKDTKDSCPGQSTEAGKVCFSKEPTDTETSKIVANSQGIALPEAYRDQRFLVVWGLDRWEVFCTETGKTWKGSKGISFLSGRASAYEFIEDLKSGVII